MAGQELFPYTTMAYWVVKILDIFYKCFQTKKGTLIWYFTNKDLQSMYHFPNPKYTCSKEYVEGFIKEHGHLLGKIRKWRQDLNNHKIKEIGKCSLDSLTTYFSKFVAIMSRLQALPDASKLLDGVFAFYIFYWATILSDNLASHILDS